MDVTGGGDEVYYENAVWLTGAAGLLTAVPMTFLYGRDRKRRMEAGLVPQRGQGRLTVPEGIWIFFIGAALAQFMNFVMVFFSLLVESDYQENMAMMEEGKSLGVLIFWLGIAAPAAEEMIFRWVVYLRLRDMRGMVSAIVVSGLLFGIYHGNIVQAIYASVLGMAFAWLLEMTGNLLTSILLHAGANIWSLVYPDLVTWMIRSSHVALLIPMLAVLAAVLICGFRYFSAKGRHRGSRCI